MRLDIVVVAFHFLVDGLDHDDGRIDHGAYRDGNAAQRHDVGIQPLCIHHDQGSQNSQWQADNDDQGRADMEKENKTDQHHHQKFFRQFALQGFNRPADQA